MIVTGIEEISKSKCKIFIDGEFAFAIYKGELSTYRIKEGKEITEEAYQQLTTQVLPKRAKLRAMNLLKARTYTEEELRRKLKQGFYAAGHIEEALAYVKSYGYVDDLAYAMDFIRYRTESLSKKQIQNKLLQKGIQKEILEDAFLECENEGVRIEEIKQINAYLEKKQYSAEKCDYKEKQKLVAALYRKGFSINSINQVMKSDFYLT
ncbi:MAG: recombination regulator RecX [Roseburia sp.]|nr:recombination regulator RecX [Roseburia sp.]MCM1277467.1 recombination regulator RecX [Robinsoniella sp.]